MASLADILATIQQGVTAGNGLVKQMTGSLNNIASQFAGITTQLSSINSQLTAFEAAWTPYTPAVSASGGTVITTATGRFSQIGKTTFVQMTITFSSGAAGSGFIKATLPNTALINQVISGRETNFSGKMLQGITQGASNIAILVYDNTYPSSNNAAILALSGVYESA